MKNKIYFLILLVHLSSFSQEVKQNEPVEKIKIKTSFIQFDASIPLAANIHRGETNPDGSKNTTWFLPNGASSKIGFGIQKNKWVGISFHTGIDWNIDQKLVAIPMFGNLRVSPSLGYGTRLTVQVGYGKGFALGRGNLVGDYRKYSIGLESDDDTIIFAEISGYDFKIHNQTSVYSFSLGFAVRTF